MVEKGTRVQLVAGVSRGKHGRIFEIDKEAGRYMIKLEDAPGIYDRQYVGAVREEFEVKE